MPSTAFVGFFQKIIIILISFVYAKMTTPKIDWPVYIIWIITFTVHITAVSQAVIHSTGIKYHPLLFGCYKQCYDKFRQHIKK